MKDLILTFIIFVAPIAVGYKFIAPKNPIKYGLIGGPIATVVLGLICMLMGDSFSDALTRVSYTFPIFIGLAWFVGTIYLMTRPEGERGEEKLKVHIFESLVIMGTMILLFWYPLQDKFFGGISDQGIYDKEKTAPKAPMEKS